MKKDDIISMVVFGLCFGFAVGVSFNLADYLMCYSLGCYQ